MKYTKEIMEKACLGAKSIAQVCRNLGLKPAGGNYITVKNILQLENLCYNRREPFLGVIL